MMYRENRLIGKANLDWQLDRYNRIKLGGEYTHYDIDSYSFQLASQAFSDFYMEKPIRYNALRRRPARPRRRGGRRRLRYDYYNTRARRWTDFPRISTNPVVRSQQSGRVLQQSTRCSPRIKSHNYISPHVQVVLPGDRADQLPPLLRPPGAVAGLRRCRCSGINTDLSVTNTNNVYGQNVDFGKYDHLRVRHPARLQRRHGAGHLGVQQGQPGERRRAAWCRSFDPLTGQQPGHPVDHQRRLRQHPRHRPAARPPLRQPVQRHAGVQLQQAKNTGSDPVTYIDFGSRVLNQVSGGNQPPPQAIPPTAFSRPHNLAGGVAELPERLAPGLDDGLDAAQNFGSSPRSGSPAARRTPAASRASATRRRLRRQLRPALPGSAQQLPAAVVQESRPAAHQGLWHRRAWT